VKIIAIAATIKKKKVDMLAMLSRALSALFVIKHSRLK
jgi:hypothetical protein